VPAVSFLEAFAPQVSALRVKADMAFCENPLSRALLGAKRTSLFAAHMSPSDSKQTLLSFKAGSARYVG
jgi:hypothetical protein